MPAPEMSVCGIHAREMPARGIHVYEMPAHETHAVRCTPMRYPPIRLRLVGAGPVGTYRKMPAREPPVSRP
jgi:hypothetical protein